MKSLTFSLLLLSGVLACDTPQPTGTSGTDTTQLDPNKSKVTHDTTMHRDTINMPDSIP